MKKILNDKLIGKIFKTFIEGFIGYLAIYLPTMNDFSDINLLKPIIVGAVASGVSALLNLIQNKLKGDE